MPYNPRPLPERAKQLCNTLGAPPRLVAHLSLVHDVAVDIVEGIQERFPDLEFSSDEVLFGAATHDLGKVLHPNELVGPGHQHEVDGPLLLEKAGVPSRMARYARTHGARSKEDLPLEDLLVALADSLWKGERLDELEELVISRILEKTRLEKWEAFSQLDRLFEAVASKGDVRLGWQARTAF